MSNEDRDAEFDDHRARMYAASEAGDLEQALDVAMVYAARYQDGSGKYFALHAANFLMELTRYEESLRILPTVKKHGWVRVHCELIRGQCLHELGRYSLASAAFEKAAEIDPVITSVFWASTLRELGEIDQMIEVLRTAIEADPTHDEAMIWLANTLEDRAPNEALRLYRRALSVDEEYGITHAHLAAFLAEHNREEEAMEHYARAYELGFEHSTANFDFEYAMLLNQRHRNREAIQVLELALRKEPTCMETTSWLAYLKALRGGPRDQLRPIFRETLAIAHRAPVVLENYGHVLARWGEDAAAVRMLREAVELGSTRALDMLNVLFEAQS